MRVKATQLLKLEDFPKDVKPWIDKIVSPVNDFLRQAITILNDGIVFPDNFVGRDYLFKFTYQTDALTFPQRFLWPLAQKPRALQVVSATEDGEPIIVAVAWEYTADGYVELSRAVRFTTAPAVALFQADKKYEIRCRITP